MLAADRLQSAVLCTFVGNILARCEASQAVGSGCRNDSWVTCFVDIHLAEVVTVRYAVVRGCTVDRSDHSAVEVPNVIAASGPNAVVAATSAWKETASVVAAGATSLVLGIEMRCMIAPGSSTIVGSPRQAAASFGTHLEVGSPNTLAPVYIAATGY